MNQGAPKDPHQNDAGLIDELASDLEAMLRAEDELQHDSVVQAYMDGNFA